MNYSAMEKRHRCKLCSRSFGNGRALGGHMRSHTLCDQRQYPKSPKHQNQEFDFSSTSVPSEDDIDSYSYSESETEEVQQRIRTVSRRSKRVPRRFIHYPSKRPNSSHDNSSLSSISDTTPEEQVARSLIMLSRDNWARAQLEFEGSSKYRCEECNKLFKSYQALGGHRASHKKIRPPPPEKVHNCPFCHKVFPSGQALGGHKRSHFIRTGTAPASTSPGAVVALNSTKCDALNIDLNLPAPVEDDDDQQIISQVDVEDVC